MPAPPPARPARSSLAWNAAAGGLAAGLALVAYLFAGQGVSPRAAAGMGVVAFICVAVAASDDPRAINWRVVVVGLALQVTLALLVIYSPPVRAAFDAAGDFVEKVLAFTDGQMTVLFGLKKPYPLAFIILPTVVFVAAVSSVLFHLRVLQAVVWVLARGLVLALGKRGVSGAEALSTVADVFLGQTEAPLVVAPYVPKMTRSELLAMMVGGMATIAGGVLAAYVGMGVPAVALLTTSVMAAPCSLYIAKIIVPETEEPVTRDVEARTTEGEYANVIEAAAGGAGDGMKLAINIVAMLLAFGALVVGVNYALGQLGNLHPALAGASLEGLFARVFAPAARLTGVDEADVPKLAELLGIKTTLNEFLAFAKMTEVYHFDKPNGMTPRSYELAAYALAGFANIASIGIQIGGTGSLPRDPADQQKLRSRLARLGPRALLGGTLATLLNAAVVGVIR